MPINPSRAGSPKERLGTHAWRLSGLEIVILAVGLAAMNAIFLSSAFRGSKTVDPTVAGQLGDFVGGYVGTGFALISVLLLVRTLQNQHRNAIREAFEAKYFTLLQLHRANIDEQRLGKAGGRKVFVMLVREWREIVPIVQRVAGETAQHLNPADVMAVSYTCLFIGTGPNSSRQLGAALAEFKPTFTDALVRALDDENTKIALKERRLGHRPFEGHQSRLGHYYRHLYQTVCFIDQHVGILSPAEGYEYAKTVRAQLSTHEQALLFLNSLTSFGAAWWDVGHLLKYRMVQNIPRDFFDSGKEIDVAVWFPAGYFEWENARPRRKTPDIGTTVA